MRRSSPRRRRIYDAEQPQIGRLMECSQCGLIEFREPPLAIQIGISTRTAHFYTNRVASIDREEIVMRLQICVDRSPRSSVHPLKAPCDEPLISPSSRSAAEPTALNSIQLGFGRMMPRRFMRARRVLEFNRSRSAAFPSPFTFQPDCSSTVVICER